MNSLFEYELLNDIFYRSERILSYLENHEFLSPIDKEAIENTILDALVYKGLINQDKESLDLDNLCICANLNHKVYEPNPNITGIPLNIKQQMRTKTLMITGNTPISVFYAKPAGEVSFCIYDMNTALSALFDDFNFVVCNYNSPTREGVKVTNRPFLEININFEKYLVDALTKRILKKSWFEKEYDMEVIQSVSKSEFDDRQKEIYAEHTKEQGKYNHYREYATFLNLALPLLEISKDRGKLDEMMYEIEESRKIFPEAFEEQEKIEEKIKKMNTWSK